MSRKRSRADTTPHGPLPLTEQVPLYARNPRGLLRPVGSRGSWRPLWKLPSSRAALLVLLGAPLAILALILLIAALQTALTH